MCYNIGIKGKGGSTQNIYYLRKETMNEDKRREVISFCQNTGMAVTLLTWIIFFVFCSPSIERPFIWILIVGLSFLVIRKVKEHIISKRSCEYPKRLVIVQSVVFFGALVLLTQYEPIVKSPKLLLLFIGYIVLGARIVYDCTSM